MNVVLVCQALVIVLCAHSMLGTAWAGVCMPSEGIWGDHGVKLFAVSIMHIDCTLVLFYASRSHGSCIGFH